MRSLFRKSLFANLTTVLVIVLGVLTLFQLQREVFPQIDFDVVTITTVFPGASPKQVERLVTNPIEDEVKTVFGIRDLFSTSTEGVSNVVVVIDPDYEDKEDAVTEIQRAVDRVDDLPPEVTDKPLVTEIKSTRQPSIQVVLRETGNLVSSYKPTLELRTKAKLLKRELEAVEGVGEVFITGEEDLEYLIEFSSEKLKAAGISVDEIVRALRTQNIAVPAGDYQKSEGNIRYRIDNELITKEKIENVILRATVDDQVFRIGDLAKISLQQQEATVYTRSGGSPSLVLGVIKNESADVIEVVDRVKEQAKDYIATINQNLGQEKWQISFAQDLTIPVRTRLKALGSSVLIGGVLVFLILLLSLNWRTAVIVAIGIPFSFLGVVLMMPSIDFSLNLLTMFGFVVVLGMIVDDAIVVSESVFTEMEKGAHPDTAAAEGTLKVIKPVLGSVTTSILAFLPLVYMSGIFGKFVKYIPSVVILCLLVSLIEAFFLLPNHMRDFTRVKKNKGHEKPHPFEKIRDFYRRAIVVCMRWRYLVLVAAFVTVGLSVFAYMQFGKFVLFPKEGLDTFFVKVEGDPKMDFPDVAKLLLPYEEKLSKYPEEVVASFFTSIGRIQTEGEETRRQGPNFGQVSVFMTPTTARDISLDEVIRDLQSLVDSAPEGTEVEIEKAAGGPPTGKPVNVVFRADDLEMLREVAEKAKDELATYEGLFSISDSDLEGKEERTYEIDFKRALQAGVTTASIGTALQMAVEGAQIDQIRSEVEKIFLRIQTPKAEKPEEAIKNLSVLSATGELIPLTDLIKVADEEPGEYLVSHYQAQRSLTVTAEIDDKKTTAVEVNQQLAQNFERWKKEYPGLQIDMLGENRDTEESFTSLKESLVYAIGAVLFVVIMTLGSVWQPILVLLTSVPMGIAGVIFIFIIHNRPLSFLAFFGLVGLVGVAVNVGIVLIDRINSLKKEMSLFDALMEGSVQRLRAVLLTSATTVLGLMPTAYGWGGGDPFLKPMALALGWGIAFSAFLGILLTPISMAISDDLSQAFLRMVRAFIVFIKWESSASKFGAELRSSFHSVLVAIFKGKPVRPEQPEISFQRLKKLDEEQKALLKVVSEPQQDQKPAG